MFQTIKEMHYFGEEQRIHFSAENDEWEMNYQSRRERILRIYTDVLLPFIGLSRSPRTDMRYS